MHGESGATREEKKRLDKQRRQGKAEDNEYHEYEPGHGMSDTNIIPRFIAGYHHGGRCRIRTYDPLGVNEML